jgi:hypothetical protein
LRLVHPQRSLGATLLDHVGEPKLRAQSPLRAKPKRAATDGDNHCGDGGSISEHQSSPV